LEGVNSFYNRNLKKYVKGRFLEEYELLGEEFNGLARLLGKTRMIEPLKAEDFK
jgi:hypothetical protein